MNVSISSKLTNGLEKSQLRNMLKIFKHSMKNYKILYIVEAILLIINFIIAISKGNTDIDKTFGAISIGIFSVLLIIINGIAQIVLFYKQIRKEYGALLFSMPIKGSEFIISKIMEVFITYFAIVLLTFIEIMIIYGSKSNILFNYSFEIIYGFFAYVIWLISLMLILAIVTTYISKGALRILAMVGIEIFVLDIYEWLVSLITDILPHINLITSEGNEFSLVKITINIIALIALSIFASKRIDENLDIC